MRTLNGKVSAITGNAHHAVGRQALHIGGDQILCGGPRHRFGGAMRLERGGSQCGEFNNRFDRHEIQDISKK